MSDTNSTKTAVPNAPKSDVSTAKPNNQIDVKDVIDRVWMGLISCIMMIVHFLNSAFEVIADAIVKLYRICLFCYRKPHHAKELLFTTIHLMRVSYDAEIWTWSDMYEVFKSHLITPMTKSVPAKTSDPRKKK